MRVPYEWLREYVPAAPPAQEVARALTMMGLAVEGIEEGEGAEGVRSDGGSGASAGRPVLEIEVTHNRPDCLCVLGAAREVSAAFGAELRRPCVVVPEQAGPAASDVAAVEILAPDLCRRYIARVVTNVRIGPSPGWMQERLVACGVRPINNIVDVTNYVMLELGQPLHAFDLDRLWERRIIVRRAVDGESITTIDGETRKLSSDMLVIADAKRAVAIAGVMGGLDTEVSEGTRSVLLEAATFDGVSVWRTSRALRMRTEASARFSRGMWPENARAGIDRAAALITAIGAGEVLPGRVDVYPRPESPRTIRLRPRRVNGLLGTDIPPREMRDALTRLGFALDAARASAGSGAEDDERWIVLVPDHRMDVSREEDLVEEVARMHGYDRIVPTLPRGAPPEARVDPARRVARRAGEVLRACGLCEVETLTFTCAAACDELRIPRDEIERDAVRISNPISSDYTMMRTTILVSLVDVLKRNAARQLDDIAVYEIGKVYVAAAGDLSGRASPREKVEIGFAIAGRIAEPGWADRRADAGFFDAKGIVETLLDSLAVRGLEFREARHPSLHPGRAAAVVAAGREIGFFGELHPEAREAAGLRKRAYVGELDLEALLEAREAQPRVAQLARFPAVVRDVAIIVGPGVASSSVERVMREAGGDLIEGIKLFDVYEGPQVPAGHRSLAYSITYRSASRTLTDDEVDRVHATVASAVAAGLGAVIRQ